MPTLIPQPTRIPGAGSKPKIIDEYIGRVNSKTSAASVAHMHSPGGWSEPGQTPEFDEFTMCDDEVVLEALAVLPPPPLVDWATAPPAPSVSMTHPNTASTPTVRTPYERKYFANCIELSTFCRLN